MWAFYIVDSFRELFIAIGKLLQKSYKNVTIYRMTSKNRLRLTGHKLLLFFETQKYQRYWGKNFRITKVEDKYLTKIW